MRGAKAAVIATLGAALFLCLPSGSWADSDEAAEEREARPHRSAEILLSMDDAARIERDREEGGSFRIRKRYGFEYAHRFDRNSEAPVVFSIQGPAMPHKRLGLTFEVRF